jgi:hypothetical protein
MYANLVTAQGRSNHFLVRRTFPLRDGFDGPVEILDSQDPDLRLYQDREYLIAYPEFVRYMADHPGTQVTFARDGVTQTSVTEAPKWWWRFFPLRSLDANNPPRCQDVWLPAL